MKIFSPEELKSQQQVIIRVLETGTPEERRKLEAAESDPELHPQIKELIISTRVLLCLVDACEGEVSFPKKPDAIDLDVLRAAKETKLAKRIGTEKVVKVFIELDRFIQDKNR